MPRKIALVAIHGQGDTREDYFAELVDELQEEPQSTELAQIARPHVYFQPILQVNQTELFALAKGDLDGLKPRKFLLYGFSDSGGLEFSRTRAGGTYELVQEQIYNALV